MQSSHCPCLLCSLLCVSSPCGGGVLNRAAVLSQSNLHWRVEDQTDLFIYLKSRGEGVAWIFLSICQSKYTKHKYKSTFMGLKHLFFLMKFTTGRWFTSTMFKGVQIKQLKCTSNVSSVFTFSVSMMSNINLTVYSYWWHCFTHISYLHQLYKRYLSSWQWHWAKCSMWDLMLLLTCILTPVWGLVCHTLIFKTDFPSSLHQCKGLPSTECS